MLPVMNPKDVQEKLAAGKIRLVDIREPQEIAQTRIPQAETVPLSVLPWAPLPAATEACPIVFTCQSSRRTTKASVQLAEYAQGPAWQMEGGVSEWQKQGLPVVKSTKAIPLERQIQIGAGSLVLAGLILSHAWAPAWWLSAFVGAGLVFAGVTGFCGLGLLLKKMPWNR